MFYSYQRFIHIKVDSQRQQIFSWLLIYRSLLATMNSWYDDDELKKEKIIDLLPLEEISTKYNGM